LSRRCLRRGTIEGSSGECCADPAVLALDATAALVDSTQRIERVTIMADESPTDRLKQEIEEIAQALLKNRPPGTELRDVWDEALTIHRKRFEHKSRHTLLLL
jgi:hypothetical protein